MAPMTKQNWSQQPRLIMMNLSSFYKCGEMMLSSLMRAERADTLATPSIDAGHRKSGKFWQRVKLMCARSFELLAESKSQFPLEV
jgi:hypothetical protein